MELAGAHRCIEQIVAVGVADEIHECRLRSQGANRQSMPVWGATGEDADRAYRHGPLVKAIAMFDQIEAVLCVHRTMSWQRRLRKQAHS